MLKSLAKRLPVIASLVAERDALRQGCGQWPPGHFYSPLVDTAEARRDADRLFPPVPRSVAGVDMNEAVQLGWLERFEQLYPSIDFPRTPSPSHRYHYENTAYSYADAITLHCMLRTLRPRRLVEVGSGHSTCVTLDTRERHLDGQLELTCIEPYPQLLESLLRPGDAAALTIVPTRVQDTPFALFEALGPGDVLFIDSTHVSKTGSDVNHLFLEVLPRLAPGVVVHVHDIFYPFEYPPEWVLGGRSWNEAYLVRALLQAGGRLEILFMNTFLEHFHEERFRARMPLCLENRGGSLWLRVR